MIADMFEPPKLMGVALMRRTVCAVSRGYQLLLRDTLPVDSAATGENADGIREDGGAGMRRLTGVSIADRHGWRECDG
jgi:hypothetical protein